MRCAVTAPLPALREAEVLAAALQGHGVGLGDVVAVAAPRHTNLPAWLLGIWLAGGRAALRARNPRPRWPRIKHSRTN